MVEATATVLSECGKRLLGELLTIVDASFGDKVQRDGVKSLVRQSCQKCLGELSNRLGAETGEVKLTASVEAEVKKAIK